MKKILMLFIKLYQYSLSPLLGPRCRFSPSCSHYTQECLEKFSLFRALWYSSLRILKCHPFCSGGVDPSPNP